MFPSSLVLHHITEYFETIWLAGVVGGKFNHEDVYWDNRWMKGGREYHWSYPAVNWDNQRARERERERAQHCSLCISSSLLISPAHSWVLRQHTDTQPLHSSPPNTARINYFLALPSTLTIHRAMLRQIILDRSGDQSQPSQHTSYGIADRDRDRYNNLLILLSLIYIFIKRFFYFLLL